MRNLYDIAHDVGVYHPARESRAAHWLQVTYVAAYEAAEWALEHGDDVDDVLIESADVAVPVYTADTWEIFSDLALWREDISELVGDRATDPLDMTKLANLAAYVVAVRIGELAKDDLEAATGEGAGECIYCHLQLTDEGDVLVDSTGGDACGVPLDNGAEHSHCRGFSPDADGDDPLVCNECLCHKADHPEFQV